jgi:hypothetical protein
LFNRFGKIQLYDNRVIHFEKHILRISEDYSHFSSEIELPFEIETQRNMFIFHFIALGCSYFGMLCLNHNFSSKNGCSNSKVNILVFETDTLLLKLQLSEVDLDIGFTLNTHFLLKDFNSVYNPYQSISSA